MAGCCGGNDNIGAVLAAQKAAQIFGGDSSQTGVAPMTFQVDVGLVRMMFIGASRGAVSYGGRGITPSGRVYRGGDNPFDKYVDAATGDVAWLENTGVWRIVPSTPMFVPSVAVPVPAPPINDRAVEDVAQVLQALESLLPSPALEAVLDVPAEVSKPAVMSEKKGRRS